MRSISEQTNAEISDLRLRLDACYLAGSRACYERAGGQVRGTSNNSDVEWTLRVAEARAELEERNVSD